MIKKKQQRTEDLYSWKTNQKKQGDQNMLCKAGLQLRLSSPCSVKCKGPAANPMSSEQTLIANHHFRVVSSALQKTRCFQSLGRQRAIRNWNSWLKSTKYLQHYQEYVKRTQGGAELPNQEPTHKLECMGSGSRS